ncbi:hypothetical protein MUK42_21423 [Musa troglodytarum]|uniref:Uncharacterized protein n=1 Tax=Musa troglodytarum TaxID=320322 RepID=A0A9E7K718_9LILI|nr:hypothetical protein MUK42_21423 [Musa troglodytarum]
MLKLRFSRQHFDSVEDNPDMPCEFGEANRKRVRHMFPFLGFPLALSINENSNSGWYHLLVCGTTPWMIRGGYGEIRDVLLKHFGRNVLWLLFMVVHLMHIEDISIKGLNQLFIKSAEVTEDGIFLVGEWIAWTQLKLCPDKERSSWREQHIACTGIQSSIVENETVYEIGRG